MTETLKGLSNVKKLAVFVASQVLQVLTSFPDLVPARFAGEVRIALFFLSAILIYAVRNQAPTVESAIEAGVDAVTTVATKRTPELDELETTLDDLLQEPSLAGRA
jgi:hypothetical protein